MPPTDVIFIEERASAGPYGAKGIGEPSLVPTAAAILNSIRDATGSRVFEVPATPERVLAAIDRDHWQLKIGHLFDLPIMWVHRD